MFLARTGQRAGAPAAPADGVSWSDGDGAEELEMEEEEVPAPSKAPPRRTAPSARAPPAPKGRGSLLKLLAVAVVAILVVSSAAVLLANRPKEGKKTPPPPPPPVNDTIAAVDVYLSEVRPPQAGDVSGQFQVELFVGEGAGDVTGWRLTTFDNDSTPIPSGPSRDGQFLQLQFGPGAAATEGLTLDTADELALYDPQGRLVDFVRWRGGNGDPVRGGWPASAPGPYPASGESLSRLDWGRIDPAAWNSTPPSPLSPNIWELELSGLRQVLWLRSGRLAEASTDIGSASLTVLPGRPVSRQHLVEAGTHLEFALRSLKRLGDPSSERASAKGAPVLEFSITNRSSYLEVSSNLDLGDSRRINSYVCARSMASRILQNKWGPVDEAIAFLREGAATTEALKTAQAETGTVAESLWLEMKGKVPYNPYTDSRALSVPFILPWTYDGAHLAGAWLFYDYLDTRYREGGFGTSLTQSLLTSGREPLQGLQEQLGRNLSVLFWDWLAVRAQPGFKYGPPLYDWETELGQAERLAEARLPPWTGWMGRMVINFTGAAELNISSEASSAGAVQVSLVSARTGLSLLRAPLQGGRSTVVAVPDLRNLDELVLTLAAGDLPGNISARAGQLPPPPSGLSPRDGTYTNESAPELSWTPVIGVQVYEAQVSWDLPFSSVVSHSRGAALSFRPAPPLSDGRYYWRVRGWTAMGNPTDWSVPAELIVDTVAPFGTPVVGEPRYRARPSDDWNVTAFTLLGFTLSPGGVSPETIHFRFLPSDPWQRYTGNFTLSGPDGRRTVHYEVEDAAGNLQPEGSLSVLLDSTAPSVDLRFGSPNRTASPGDAVNISSSTPLSLEVSDAGAGLKEGRYKIDYLNWTPYTGEFNLSGQPEGPHLISLSAQDNLGNAVQRTVQVYLDLTAPNLTVQNLTTGILSAGRHLVRAQASDRSGVASVTFLVDGALRASAPVEPYDWDWNTAAEVDGNHNIEVRAADHLGNAAQVTLTVLTDNTAPVTTLTVGDPKHRAGSSDDWNVSQRTKFTLSAQDATSGVALTWYAIDGNLYQGTEFTLTALPNGLHNLSYASRDRCGVNETTRWVLVRLDNSPPVPRITSPSQGDTISGIVTVQVADQSASSDISNLTLEYSSDGNTYYYIGNDTDGSDGWSVDWDTKVHLDSAYWLKATFHDVLGNAASDSVVVTVKNN